MKLRLLAVGLSVAALSGCGTYPAPKITAPPAWAALTAQPEAAPPTEAVNLPDATWWTGFKSDELTALVNEALTNSHTLKAAVERILQAEATAKITTGSLFPSLSAGGSVNRNDHQVRGAPNLVTTSYSANLQASYQLDLFGQLRDNAASARERLRSSIYDQQTVAITLVSNVVTAYLQTLSFRERLSLAEDRLKNAREILDLLELQRRVGTLSDLELAQQRSALATQEAEIPALRLGLRQQLNQLAILIGRPPEGFDIKGQSLRDVDLPQVAAGIPSLILTRRPDVRAAESDLRAANFDLGAARAARFPSIQLTGQGGSASSALSTLFETGTLFYTVAASVGETLFAGGRLQGQEQLARGRYRELLENYRQSVLSAFSDVENALSAVRENNLQYDYARVASSEADTAYRLAQLRYRSGVVDFETVLNAQNSAFQAQESVVQSELSRFTATVGLAQALGGGWDGTLPAPPPLSKLSDPV
jgi:NodT family efflux transporter outer membrane factor (OMF) lipoprotein